MRAELQCPTNLSVKSVYHAPSGFLPTLVITGWLARRRTISLSAFHSSLWLGFFVAAVGRVSVHLSCGIRAPAGTFPRLEAPSVLSDPKLLYSRRIRRTVSDGRR